jgi:hypothetical protein
MSTPPAYVSHVEIGAIVIANVDRATAKRLREAGLDVRTSWFGDARLPTEAPKESGESSDDESDKMIRLARAGIAFAADYKQGMDPVGMMLDLVTRGRYVGTFRQITFTDPEHWQLKNMPSVTPEDS